MLINVGTVVGNVVGYEGATHGQGRGGGGGTQLPDYHILHAIFIGRESWLTCGRRGDAGGEGALGTSTACVGLGSGGRDGRAQNTISKNGAQTLCMRGVGEEGGRRDGRREEGQREGRDSRTGERGGEGTGGRGGGAAGNVYLGTHH